MLVMVMMMNEYGDFTVGSNNDNNVINYNSNYNHNNDNSNDNNNSNNIINGATITVNEVKVPHAYLRAFL